MKISIITNRGNRDWHPKQLETFLGGNEESLVLFSAALVKSGHKVSIYAGLPAPFDWNGVQYFPLSHFDFDSHYEVLISFKDRTPWLRSVSADVRIHWSNDVESRWSDGCLAAVDRVVTIGTYHRSRMEWLPESKNVLIPLGVNMSAYKPGEKKQNLCIYATSPDRGLETLLQDWARIRENRFPGDGGDFLNLFITYDWSGIQQTEGARRLAAMAQQPGIAHSTLDQKGMAALFGEAEYYIHPLNRADSDLFGFGAIKAQMAGCKLVLPSVDNNGFRDSAREYIPYQDFVRGSDKTVANPHAFHKPISWGDLVKQKWEPMFREILQGVRHAA